MRSNVEARDSVCDLLARLGNPDAKSVFVALGKASKAFANLDANALELAGDAGSLEEQLSGNAAAFQESTPVEESIFFYSDLSVSQEVWQRIIDVRELISGCIEQSYGTVQYADLRVQHSTTFIYCLGTDVGITERAVSSVASRYDDVVRGVEPFNLWVGGAHLTPFAGVILECHAYGTGFYRLRDYARNDREAAPVGERRPVHEIIHSTVGYIAEAKPRELMRLHSALEEHRVNVEAIPVRVREGRAIATRNKGLVGQPVLLPFLAAGREPLNTGTIERCLRELGKVASTVDDHELRRVVLEEAMYWVETSSTMKVRATAQQVASALHVGKDRAEIQRNR